MQRLCLLLLAAFSCAAALAQPAADHQIYDVRRAWADASAEQPPPNAAPVELQADVVPTAQVTPSDRETTSARQAELVEDDASTPTPATRGPASVHAQVSQTQNGDLERRVNDQQQALANLHVKVDLIQSNLATVRRQLKSAAQPAFPEPRSAPKAAPISPSPLRRQPPRLIGVDQWGGVPNAVFYTQGRIATVATGESVDGWSIESIDRPTRRVTVRSSDGDVQSLTYTDSER